MHPIPALILMIINIYIWILIAMVVMSWLVGFNVLDTRNPVVAAIYRGLLALTEPVLRPIRRYLPAFGGFDLSPVVAFIALWFIAYTIRYYAVML